MDGTFTRTATATLNTFGLKWKQQKKYDVNQRLMDKIMHHFSAHGVCKHDTHNVYEELLSTHKMTKGTP